MVSRFFFGKGKVGEVEFLRKSLGLRIFENISCSLNVCMLEIFFIEINFKFKSVI